MLAIVTAVLEGTLGLLLKKGRQSLSDKLKDGDVANQQLRSWILSEIDNVNSKLEAFARRDLKTSVSFFKEGLVFLKKVITTETGPNAVEGKAEKPGACHRVTEVTTAGVNILNLAEEMRELNLTDLDDSGKATLSDAKKRFYDARREATKAFNNEALTPCDRILAMAVRLMATILEKVENPVSVLEVCRSGLEELHSTAMVEENFKVELTKALKVKLKMKRDERREIISLVCHINRIIYDVTLLMGKNKDLFLLPCVDIGDEKVDPLRDVRVAATLRKVKMGDCCVVWSFSSGEAGQEEQEPNSIATNTNKQFLIVDGNKVKVYDTIGTFLNSFGIPADQDESSGSIKAVATDREDDMYVLVNDTKRRIHSSYIYVFNKEASFRYKFLVDSHFWAETVILGDNHLLIQGMVRLFEPTPSARWVDRYVVVLKRDGENIGQFAIPDIPVRDITADDNGNIMVLDDCSCVYVFADITTNDGDDEPKHDFMPFYQRPLARLINKFEVAPEARAIVFHWTTGTVIIASQTPNGRSQVLLYSKEGKLERNIDIELKKDFIGSAAVTIDGSICVNAGEKVLVLF